MSLWSRIVNVWRGDRLSAEIDEELQAHIEEAIAQGRDPSEARQALGSALHVRERSRDVKLLPWLDSLRADVIFGWRQLRKRKVTSAAAILSLALGMGTCTSAFRLVDALLLRPLPVVNPERLYALSRLEAQPSADGRQHAYDGWAYPAFRRMRAAVKDQADLIALASSHSDLTYASNQEVEKANVQYVSGSLFSVFGLQPALGRLLTENDDLEPGAHPYAVLSYAYWAQRFAKDPKVVGSTFQMGNRIYEIIGVCQGPFTGTEPGSVTDVFVPIMMNPAVDRRDSTWHETLAKLKPGVDPEPVRQRLNAASLAFETERAAGFAGMSKHSIELWLKQKVLLEPAASGRSGWQKAYRGPLNALAVLVGLVLLIACVNVANLMTAQAAARAREMALRVSIGAGRWRLVQLVLVESAWLALLAGAAGALFAWWSAPFVVSMLNGPLDSPAQLSIPLDWRVLSFELALIVTVLLLFGLAPALRASAVQPAGALRGGDDPHSRRRLMHALVSVQVVFCFLVLFATSLFVATFERLSHQPTGFSADGLLTLETVTEHSQPAVYWDAVADHLRAIPGVETVAMCSRPLLSGYSSNDGVAVNGGPPSEDMAYFLNVSPGWLEEMKIPLIQGRDFGAGDTYPGMAIVSETFAKRFFDGKNPVGRVFERAGDDGSRLRLQVVGLVRDALYMGIRGPILPVAYIPFHELEPIRRGTFIVRTSNSNEAVLRREVSKARAEFRVTNVEPQTAINRQHTFRERLLAALAVFFGLVALLLAGVGLYGVLDYSVLQRRREIGIRMALGARAAGIARLVTVEVFWMVLAGALAGISIGLAGVRYVESLIYEVKATDLAMLALPSVAILAIALLAAVPAVVRALRIDPVHMLRSE
jgi:predicted permease